MGSRVCNDFDVCKTHGKTLKSCWGERTINWDFVLSVIFQPEIIPNNLFYTLLALVHTQINHPRVQGQGF